MRNQIHEVTETTAQVVALNESSSYSSGISYVEWADVPVQESNALELLQKNLEQLEDLRHRLSFVMREVRYQMKA